MGTKLIASNKKAYFEYYVEEKYEAGIELFGTEVKSIRRGSCSIKESFCKIYKGECYIINMHINPYEEGNIFNKDPYRSRKLLLHKKEIKKIDNAIQQDGMTLVPLQVYFSGQKVKIEIAICKGKKLYDKRAVESEKTAKRNINRALKKV